jgi:hypothetical protein
MTKDNVVPMIPYLPAAKQDHHGEVLSRNVCWSSHLPQISDLWHVLLGPTDVAPKLRWHRTVED